MMPFVARSSATLPAETVANALATSCSTPHILRLLRVPTQLSEGAGLIALLNVAASTLCAVRLPTYICASMLGVCARSFSMGFAVHHKRACNSSCRRAPAASAVCRRALEWAVA